MEAEINVLAVIAATVSSMVVGSIWYARSVFGNRWIKLAKIDTSKDKGSMVTPMVKTLLVSLITAYTLALFAYIAHKFFGNSFLEDSLSTALWLWAGFTAARFITHDAFEGRPHTLTLINLGNEFVTIMLMGLVIGLMGT